MEAIWFLDALPPGELPGYLVINHQGRYVLDGDRLEGAGRAATPSSPRSRRWVPPGSSPRSAASPRLADLSFDGPWPKPAPVA